MYRTVANSNERQAGNGRAADPVLSGSSKSRRATAWLAAAMLALPAAGCRSGAGSDPDLEEPRSGTLADEERYQEREGSPAPELPERE